MATGTFTFYEAFVEYVGDGTIDLDDDTFKVLLVTEDYTPDVSAHDLLSEVTANEISSGGYARPTLANVTWTRSGDTGTFDCDDFSITFTTGAEFKYAIFYDDTPTSPLDPLIGYVDLENSGGSIEIIAGNTFTLEMNASGVFQMAIA